MFKRIAKLFGSRSRPRNGLKDELPVTVRWDDLTVDTSGVDLLGLLSGWRWLVSEESEPFLLSSMGDLFLRSREGQVFLLDTCAGEIKKAAEDIEEFKALAVTEEKALEWFRADLVGAMKARGKSPGRNRCFSYRIPPVLGGSFDPSNIEVTDVDVHFWMMGQIHEQVKDLPPGTPITGVTIA